MVEHPSGREYCDAALRVSPPKVLCLRSLCFIREVPCVKMTSDYFTVDVGHAIEDSRFLIAVRVSNMAVSWGNCPKTRFEKSLR